MPKKINVELDVNVKGMKCNGGKVSSKDISAKEREELRKVFSGEGSKLEL